MLPYLEPMSFGPINSFGLLVLLGVFFGSTAAYRHSERLGLDQGQVRRMALFCGVFGLLGAHLVDVLLYQPGWARRSDAVWVLLNPLSGISSMGGVIGGTVGFFAFAHISEIKKLRFADTAAFGMVVLLVFGRAGCASVHDHVGVATDFTLAVDFPAGNPAGVVGPHHDLGLYELVLMLALLAIAALVIRRPRRPGILIGILAVGYSVPRFFMDFLRRPATDPRYVELTAAQWTTAAMFVAGLTVLLVARRYPRPPPDSYARPTPWRRYLADLVRGRARSSTA